MNTATTNSLILNAKFAISHEGKRQRRLRALWDLADIRFTVTLVLPSEEMVTEFKNLSGATFREILGTKR